MSMFLAGITKTVQSEVVYILRNVLKGCALDVCYEVVHVKKERLTTLRNVKLV